MKLEHCCVTLKEIVMSKILKKKEKHRHTGNLNIPVNTPNDQMSDLLLNLEYLMTSGAAHLTGNLEQ